MSINGLTTDSVGYELLFLGNEAIARGVIEAGVQVVAAYPGTPSSEVVASLARVAKITGQYVEWSTNEKVAFECAAGASFLGCRAFTAMKNVGLNVALDTLMVVNITGIEGGFVFLVADDPNCWSTQNEQDSRLLSQAAEIPCLEPSSAQEAKDMTVYAYELSEKLRRPVMLRTVTRLSHSRALVKLGPIYKKKPIPRYYSQKAGFPALPKHKTLHKEKSHWQKVLSECRFNRWELKSKARVGIITAGNATNYVNEALSNMKLDSDIGLLKIGVINPLPDELIKSFLAAYKTIVVFEEIEPLIESHVKALSSDLSYRPLLIGKLSGNLEVPGELKTEKVMEVIAKTFDSSKGIRSALVTAKKNELLLDRDPVLCAGCPHMGSLYAIRKATKKKKFRALISGDIGCYGLGVFPPYNSFDSHLCMGASIGIGNGYAATGYRGPIVCVLGDSTFYHSGIPALINAVFNKHNITVIILDNASIAMTGHQPAPGTGLTATGEQTKKIDLTGLVRACGVDHVTVANPFQIDSILDAIKTAISYEGPSVVIAEGECAILASRRRKPAREIWHIDEDHCDSCGICVNLLYCPALNKGEDSYSIDHAICAACGICAQVCPKEAIKRKDQVG
ncbi:indolepyruvate ferredoxin oxidoreductase subunit alpha [Thermodesulfobacteriota bacterium]